MRKIFTLLTLCLLATAAWAQTEIVFTPGETVGTQESVSTNDEMNKDGVVISTTYGAFKTAQYRFGKNAVTTFTSSAGNITKIQFTCTSTNPANGFGDNAGLTFDGNDGTWTGNAAEVVLTTYTKQVRATKIVVTVEGGGLAKPTIKPAAGTYYSPIEVTITCGTNGANIHYTTDGSTPTTNSPKYTAPFTLSTSTTVKAISAKDGDVSDVVEAAYEFQNATPVANIAEFQNAADETVVVFRAATACSFRTTPAGLCSLAPRVRPTRTATSFPLAL